MSLQRCAWRVWLLALLACSSAWPAKGFVTRVSSARRLSLQTKQNSRPAEDKVTPALLLPVAVAYDAAGNLFFADARRHQIFELSVAGAWSVVAGTGDQGFAGDGGAATAALLNTPRGLAVGADGTVYIADTGNQRIRAVSKGVITTVAGTGVRGYTGDGVALQEALADPTALALDGSGNLLVCDTANDRVRRISSGNIGTVAGNGVQGFAGDGAVAVAAELDTPMGIAVNASGTLFIADTHNQRVRSVSAAGVIATFAGTGSQGFAGDGSAATLAALSLPFGLTVGGDGALLIADAGNQRIRSVSSAGVITTIVGSGVQGIAADATSGTNAALNSPRAVTLQAQGQPVFADASNGLVRELANDNALYTLALLSAPRATTTVINMSSPAMYGEASARVSVTGSAATPQGTVSVLVDGSSDSTSQLIAGSALIDLSRLAAGSHTLTATYAGDGLNATSASVALPLVVAAAPLTATANAASSVYGEPLPPLTGTLTGIPAQDLATVRAIFSSSASSLSPVGTYPITASLSGAGSTNYIVSLSASSGALVISQANSVTTLSPVSQTYAGLPTLLSAAVNTTTTGVPSGTVDFLDGSVVISSVPLVHGASSASVLSTAQGSHSFSARYKGDTNFLPSTSSAAVVSAATMPDFDLAVSGASQSVQGGSVAVFTLNVAPQDGAFTGAVILNVTGLPPGATASFSPSAIVPGSSGGAVTLSVQTVARTASVRSTSFCPLSMSIAFASVVWLFIVPRRLHRRWLLVSLCVVFLFSSAGCGTRTTGSSVNSGQSYVLTISGTSTNLAGTPVVHTASATLTVL